MKVFIFLILLLFTPLSITAQSCQTVITVSDDMGNYAIDDIGQYVEVSRTEQECPPLSTLKVYPNPTTDILKIENTEGQSTEGEIYSSDERMMRQFTGNETDIGDLPQGIYLLRINNVNFKIMKR